MATIKSYTTVEQSRKLSEILPLESADMYYSPLGGTHPWVLEDDLIEKDAVLCWSLAALLEQLDDEITDEEGNDYTLTIVKENLQYQLYYHDALGRTEDIETDYYDYMVDACYEIIIKLHELNLL